jgi:hypothetical protein
MLAHSQTIAATMHRAMKGRAPGTEDRLQSLVSVIRSLKSRDGIEAATPTEQGAEPKLASLGKYLTADGVGVRQHEALLTGYYLERLMNDKILEGQKVKIVSGQTAKNGDVHTWAEFIAKDGTEYIVDPEWGYVGAKNQSPKRQ